MKKTINITFLIIIFILFLISGCVEPLWTGELKTGTIDKSCNYSERYMYYWEKYNIYWSGTWDITIESTDGILMYCEIHYDDETLSYKITDKTNLLIYSNRPLISIYLKVYKNNDEFEENDYEAGYSIYTILK